MILTLNLTIEQARGLSGLLSAEPVIDFMEQSPWSELAPALDELSTKLAEAE